MEIATRPGRGVESRRDLMQVAIDCFARYGFQATSIDRIAKAAGVTKGALYYHFADKEELLFAAVKNRIGQFERRVAGDLTPIADAPAALQEVARLCFDHATKSNHRRFIVTLMVEALDTNPRLAAEFRGMMHRFREFLSGIVREGQASGQFRADVDAGVAAEVYAGAIMGAEIQYYQDPKRFDLAATLAAFIQQYVGWLLLVPPNGRRATPPKAATLRTRRT
jgi:TetR/AcrR family acrAB operon transcriptional repressor